MTEPMVDERQGELMIDINRMVVPLVLRWNKMWCI
jgi:hypothetical protein